MAASFVLAIHSGAGQALGSDRKSHKTMLINVLSHVAQVVEWDSSASDVVTSAVTALENAVLTNAGIGSSLTFDGRVECDAAVCTKSSVGAVGAVEGVRHPCRLADEIRKYSTLSGPLGLRPPVLLTGNGARQFATEHCNIRLDSECHITESNRTRWAEYRRRFDDVSRAGTVADEWNPVTDTVGAVCIDVQGAVAAAVSSGGNWLKASGRVGAAAVPGAALSALDSVAVAASGNGESMVRSSFALQSALYLEAGEDVDIHGELRRLSKECAAGMISLRKLQDMRVEFLYVHGTPSFSFGYWCPATMTVPRAWISSCSGQTHSGGCVLRMASGSKPE
jgi:taspase, threonine aspartase, 1